MNQIPPRSFFLILECSQYLSLSANSIPGDTIFQIKTVMLYLIYLSLPDKKDWTMEKRSSVP